MYYLSKQLDPSVSAEAANESEDESLHGEEEQHCRSRLDSVLSFRSSRRIAHDENHDPTSISTAGDLGVRECLSRSPSEVFRRTKHNEAVMNLFEEIDTFQTGSLDKSELCHFFSNFLKDRNIKMEDDVVKRAVDTLVADVTNRHDDNVTISKDEFLEIFEDHQDLCRVFESSLCDEFQRSQDSSSNELSDFDYQEDLKYGYSMWHSLKAYWKNSNQYAAWIVLYFAMLMFLFIRTAIKWANNDEATEVFGNCVVVARASAKAINFHAALILLPVARHVTTWTRISWLRFFLFPMDALQKAHMFLGMGFLFFTTTHVLAHCCDYVRFIGADQDDILALLEDRVDEIPPEDPAGRLNWALRQRATATGIYMLICMGAAYFALYHRRENFNRFFTFHHLLLFVLVLLCVHGTGNLLEHYQSIYWVLGPLSLYVIPRIYREIKCSTVKVVHASIHDDILEIRFAKPSHWKWIQKPGMYVNLNVPELRQFEWHPFTISSSPAEDHVGLHIKAVGDWTAELHDFVAQTKVVENLRIRVEGPIGAPSQQYRDHAVVVMVGAGIGVTPMVSVVRSLLDNPGKVRKAFFYWTMKEPSPVFNGMMEDIFERDTKNLIEIRHFITSVKRDDRNFGDILFHYAANAVHHESNLDIVLGYRIKKNQVQVGRPKWSQELRHAVETTKELGETECGVFLCGPEKMAEEVRKESLSLSKEDNGVHVYFSKEIF